jgi:CspA family cold shock protein
VQVQELPRQEGRVKWFNPKKRFGFIVQADGNEIFVHQSDLVGVSTLKPEQEVSFAVEQSGKGPKAIRVCVVSDVNGG